jgi:hypothetical protein
MWWMIHITKDENLVKIRIYSKNRVFFIGKDVLGEGLKKGFWEVFINI